MKTDNSAPKNDWDVLADEISALSVEWYTKGLAMFPQKELPLEIKFNLTGGTAGMAYTNNGGKHIVRFNLGLAMENREDFFARTIPHEIAHIIANMFFNDNCGHGELWVSVMRKFGVKDVTRCHSYDVENHVHSHRNFKWVCQDCSREHFVGKNLHEKLANRSTKHRCKCGSRALNFSGKKIEEVEII